MRNTLKIVHFRDKETVASRLTLAALSSAYSQGPALFYGPRIDMLVYTEVVPAGTGLMEFSGFVLFHLGSVDTMRAEVRSPLGFEMQCCTTPSATNCSWFNVTISKAPDGNVTWRAAVPDTYDKHNCLKARYAWTTTPCAYKQCALYDRNLSLPTPPWVGPLSHFAGLGEPAAQLGRRHRRQLVAAKVGALAAPAPPQQYTVTQRYQRQVGCLIFF